MKKNIVFLLGILFLFSCNSKQIQKYSLFIADSGELVLFTGKPIWLLTQSRQWIPVVQSDDRMTENGGVQFVFNKNTQEISRIRIHSIGASGAEMHSDPSWFWKGQEARWTAHAWVKNRNKLLDTLTKKEYKLPHAKDWDIYADRFLVLLRKNKLQIFKLEHGEWVLHREIARVKSFLLSKTSPFVILTRQNHKQVFLVSLYSGSREILETLPDDILELKWLKPEKIVFLRTRDHVFFFNLKTRTLQMGPGGYDEAALSVKQNILYLLKDDELKMLDWTTKSNLGVMDLKKMGK